MPKESTRFNRALKAAVSAASEVEDIRKLPPPTRILVAVRNAQGIIDNGGLQYLFEADFPGKPPYSVFVNAYRAIGATDAADTLARVVALFPFANPHKYVRKRNAFLDSFKDEDGDPVNSPFEPLSDRLCGDKEVWDRLRAFVERNAARLGV